MPKLLVYRLLKPALALPQPVYLTCREGKLRSMLADLVTHELDIVIADSPAPPSVKVEAHTHLLAESSVLMFGTSKLATRYRRKFPLSLNGAPLLLPTRNAGIRRALDDWLMAENLSPRFVGEFEGSETFKVFGRAGHGLFPAAALVEQELDQQYGVRVAGRFPGVRQNFHAITVERKLRHPALVAISDTARHRFVG